MKQVVFAAVALLASSGPAAVAAPPHPQPRRIMSLKLCTDAMLLDLVVPARIASISYLSRAPDIEKIWPQAKDIPVNHNSAEEILAVRPDLVLADDYTDPATLALTRRAGIAVVTVPDANSFAAIRAVLRKLAHAVGAEARGEALIAHMDGTLRRLAATRPARAIRVLGWGDGGYVPGPGSLFDAILTAAGGVDIAGARSSFDIEQLLSARPDLLAISASGYSGKVLRDDQTDHPLVLSLYAGKRVYYPPLPFTCGLPQSADAARALRGAMLRAMR